MDAVSLQTIVDGVAMGQGDQVVSLASIANIFVSVNLRGCSVAIDGDDVSITSKITAVAQARAESRAAEMVTVEAQS